MRDIVLGGIYEFYDKHLSQTYAVTVRSIQDDMAKIDLPYVTFYVDFNMLGRQIGYDVTFSDAYQLLQQKRDTLKALAQATELIVDYEKTPDGFYPNHITDVWRLMTLYKNEIRVIREQQQKLIDEKSWMEVEA